jgi:hypothetical protein
LIQCILNPGKLAADQGDAATAQDERDAARQQRHPQACHHPSVITQRNQQGRDLPTGAHPYLHATGEPGRPPPDGFE